MLITVALATVAFLRLFRFRQITNRQLPFRASKTQPRLNYFHRFRGSITLRISSDSLLSFAPLQLCVRFYSRLFVAIRGPFFAPFVPFRGYSSLWLRAFVWDSIRIYSRSLFHLDWVADAATPLAFRKCIAIAFRAGEGL
jgi:hypothetical protein